MKKLLILLALFVFTLSAAAAAETAYNVDYTTHQKYKAELEKKGWLYGCTPPNWSLVEPFRGGFVSAVLKNRVDIMELEVKAGLNPSSCTSGKTSLAHIATYYKKNGDALEFLLKNGVNPNSEGYTHTPLTMAIYYKNINAVDILLKNGANPNFAYRNIAPINYALKKKNPEIVKLLLNAGAKPNEKTLKLVQKSKKQEIKDLFNEK